MSWAPRWHSLIFACGLAAAAIPARADEPWSISPGGALVWHGAPYAPVGLRIDGSPAAIAAAAAEGFKSVCVELPASGEGWSEAFAALQKARLDFLVAINSMAHPGIGYAVEPEGLRITDFPEGKPVSAEIPGATWVLAVFASVRDGEIFSSQRVQTPGGKFQLALPETPSSETVLLLYPHMASARMPDFYEGFDKQRDELLGALRRQKNLAGLRGIVDPAGAVVQLPSPTAHFVPSSPYFQFEFRAFIKSKYHAPETAEQSWGMQAPDIDTFEALARLVPLWYGERGVLSLWDPTSDKLYRVDSRRSTIWTDIQSVVNDAARRRFHRLTEAIHAVAQVPVVQSWAGWSIPYEGGEMVDGVGMQAGGAGPVDLMDGAARAASSALRWRKPCWLLATRIDLDDASPDDVGPTIDDLASVGARGVFARADKPAVRKALLAAADRIKTDAPVRPFFYPEDATTPAEPERLPNDVWWLPAPIDGNRLDFGDAIEAYRYNDGTGDRFAYWTPNQPLTVLMRVNDAKNVTAAEIDGTPIPIRRERGGFKIDLGPTPIVIKTTGEIPIPEVSRLELAAKFDALAAKADSEHRDLTGPAYLFETSLQSFDENPGGAYAGMLNAYGDVVRAMSPYQWIEGEAALPSNFGERTPIPGCSSNVAYRVQSLLSQTGHTTKIAYRVFPRTTDQQELWLAAAIPPALRSSVRVLVGTQELPLPAKPVSAYGVGFGWYDLGPTRLGAQGATITVEIRSDDPFEVAIDVLLLTPGMFEPHGVRLPDPIVFSAPKKGR